MFCAYGTIVLCNKGVFTLLLCFSCLHECTDLNRNQQGWDLLFCQLNYTHRIRAHQPPLQVTVFRLPLVSGASALLLWSSSRWVRSRTLLLMQHGCRRLSERHSCSLTWIFWKEVILLIWHTVVAGSDSLDTGLWSSATITPAWLPGSRRRHAKSWVACEYITGIYVT